jgi:hypothetical protein
LGGFACSLFLVHHFVGDICGFNAFIMTNIVLLLKSACPIILSLLFFATNVRAQKKPPTDYVVTSRGDTLRGQLQELPKAWDHQKVFFRAAGAKDWIAYGTAEVVALGLNSEQSLVVRPATLNEQKGTYFLEEVAAGHLSVYAATNQQGEAVFFVQKGGGDVLPLHPKFYASLLSSLTGDCPGFMRNAKGELANPYAYLRSSLARMARDYNRCAHPSTVHEVAKAKKKLKFSFGASGGVNSSSLIPVAVTGEYIVRTYENAVGWSVGGLANLDIGGPVSFQAEFWVTTRGGSYTDTDVDNFVPPMLMESPTVTVLTVPILMRFDLLKKGVVRPYVVAGPSIRLAHFSQNAAVSRFDMSSRRTFTRELPTKMGNVEFVGGVGVEFRHPVGGIFFESRINRMADHPEGCEVSFPARFRTFQFLLGFRF